MRVLFSIIILALFFAACSNLPGDVDHSCIARIQEYHVLGHSLEGTIAHESNVTILEGYHQCNAIREGDVVLFASDIRPNPIIKIAKGLPGDNISMENYTLYRNGEILRNFNGTPYRIAARSSRLLSGYLNSTPTIPPDHYLLLGNDPLGGLDSSQLGYIPKSAIIGVADCCGRFRAAP